MNKKAFLKSLKTELAKYDYDDAGSFIEYYDELIEERLENGEKEEKIISGLGNVKDIVKGINIDKKLAIATKKPNISNGFKALIAVLSLCSLPILIPLIICVIAFGITGLILLLSLVIVLVSFIFASVVTIVGLFAALFFKNLPFLSFLFALGLVLLLTGLFLIFTKWLLKVTKDACNWFVQMLKKRVERRKEVADNE